MNGVYENKGDKMSRPSREVSMGLRIGDTIIHCNDEFVIVDIRREERSEGLQLSVFACDSEQANKKQQDDISRDQIMSKVEELIKKVAEKGLGGLGDIGRG